VLVYISGEASFVVEASDSKGIYFSEIKYAI
jgi:hypothetical protein